MNQWWLSLALPLPLLLTSCGEERRYGDADGHSVRFEVHLERGFVRAMSNRQWTPSGTAVVTSDSAGGTTVSSGVGFTFSSTSVYLYGGTSTAAADVFIHELSWGDNVFTVPLKPGRTLCLTVKATGGREGWEALTPALIPRAEDPAIRIRLTATQEQVSVTPAVIPPETPSSAAGAPPAVPAVPTADVPVAAPVPALAPPAASASGSSPSADAGGAPPVLSAAPPVLSATPPAPAASVPVGPAPAAVGGSELSASPETPAAAGPTGTAAAAPTPVAQAPAAAGTDPAGSPAPLLAPGITVNASHSASPEATQAAAAGASTPDKKMPAIFAPPVPAVSPAAPYPDPALQDK